jgi:glycosyltransferase involved in cell wall biosynthesis/SAM-dependent methyltransferase
VRVLFVSWRELAHPKAGGSEVVVDELARGLMARGHEVAVMSAGPVGARPYPVIANGGDYSQYLTAPVRYARHFRNADLVVEVANGMPFFSPLWRRGPRVVMVHHVHGEQWDRYFPAPVAATAGRLESTGLPLAYRNTHILTISESSGHELEMLGVEPSRIHVLYLGARVTPPPEPLEPGSGPLFVALGRLAPNKRLDLLLDLWKRVAPATGGRLVIAGDGPERDRLAARVRTERGLESVSIEGKVSEERKAALLSAATLLVHTAEREGWGLGIIEAGLCGTPSVAFDVAGVRDAIVDGETGIVAASSDELVDAWIALARDPVRLQAMGEAAAARAASFTWEAYVDDFLGVAKRAIEEHTTGEHDLVHHPLAKGPTKGLTRSVHLFKLFRREPVDPDRFYHYLAADTLRQLRRYVALDGCTAVDIGGGPGYTAEALKAAGARCLVVEYNFEELGLHDRTPDEAVQGDGQALPLREGSVRLVHSSNVLEHVPDWRAMLSEMVRILEPGSGVGYLNFTNWFSPWGGHETSPWHYLGGASAVDRYVREHGVRPKNEYGVSLFELHIAEVLDWFAAQSDVEVLWVGPRYLPDWTRWVVRVPGLREIVTWNLVIVFRRVATGTSRPGSPPAFEVTPAQAHSA